MTSETRRALHALAEHVLAAARWQRTSRIGLCVLDGALATPLIGDEGRRVAIRGDRIVVTVEAPSRRTVADEPVTTLRRAAALAGCDLGGPASVYRLVTAVAPDAPLVIDAAQAGALTEVWERGDAALRTWRDGLHLAPDAVPPAITLWPEHLDVALAHGEVNYGVSPGDETIDEPYAYVGPWARPLPTAGDGFWNAEFGAARPMSALPTVHDVVGFFAEGRARSL